MSDVTVITPSLAERHEYRQDCIASVAAQTVRPDAHLVSIDYEGVGVVEMLNRLWPAVRTTWTLVLADDDLLDADYLQSVLGIVQWGTASDGRMGTRHPDIYYAYCRVVGRPGFDPNQPFDAERLRASNYIPATALIRTELIAQLGGWRDHVSGPGLEDWDFWLRALDAGARFRCLRRIKWTYRFHGRNLSWPYSVTPQAVSA